MLEPTRRGMHGQTVDYIGQRILSGELAEGQTIDLTELAAELAISRTVIREALKVLDTKGLVGARQKRGTFVRPRTDWNMLDRDILRWQFAGHANAELMDSLHEVRGIVEPASAALAAKRRTDDDLVTLEKSLQQMADATNAEEATKADLSFHRALLTATHNELLAHTETVIDAGLQARDMLVHGQPVAPDPVPRHRRVFEAVRRQQPDDAEVAMRELLRLAHEDLSNVAT